MRRHLFILMSALVLAGIILAAFPASGQSAPPMDARDRWTPEVTPYLWGAGLQGDPSFSDFLKDLDVGLLPDKVFCGVLGDVGYRLGDHWPMAGGDRRLGNDFEDGCFTLDAVLRGRGRGAGFRF